MVRPAARLPHSPWAVLAAVWVAAVGLIALLEHTVGLVAAHDLASSPDRLWGGAVWTLLTSGLVIQGPPVAQFVMVAAVTAFFVARLGAGMFWVVALAGHVGATLVTYVAVGAMWLVSRSTAERLIDTPDFGISAVLAASLGALTVAAWKAGIHRRALLVVGLSAVLLMVAAIDLDGELADIEHLLAYVCGAGAAAGALHGVHPGFRNAE